MCGILCVLGETSEVQLGKLSHRGPDGTATLVLGRCRMEFSRLAINDLTSTGMQPFTSRKGMLVCNGEIYNHAQFSSNVNDCACLIPLIEKYGILDAPKMLLGEFALCYSDGISVKAARDPFGVRPLFYTRHDETIAFASEAKALLQFGSRIEIFPPGHVYDSATNVFTRYYSDILLVKRALKEAVRTRVTNTDKELGFLLSGGLDSSLVVALAHKTLKTRIKTFSVGIEDSPDVLAARVVAKYFDTEHTEFRFDVQEGLDNLENVIWNLESYDTTTVRASVPMWLLSRYISQNTNCRVILSGEGSDELFGGYLYFHYAPDADAFYDENTRRLRLIHQFDGLRADRCMAAHGLELRVPFLDINVVDAGMNMDRKLKLPRDGIEKWYLRQLFEGFLPPEILWRQKNGMSDAVGYAWVKTVKEYAEKEISDEEFGDIKVRAGTHNVPLTKEEALYRKIFWKRFGDANDHLISEIWRPMWTDVTDPSATQLNVHEAHT
jgi:asparagine synthase (glutamine-hydrolysing)